MANLNLTSVLIVSTISTFIFLYLTGYLRMWFNSFFHQDKDSQHSSFRVLCENIMYYLSPGVPDDVLLGCNHKKKEKKLTPAKPEIIIIPVTNFSGIVTRYDVIADYGLNKEKKHICYQTKLYMATQVKDNVKKLLN